MVGRGTPSAGLGDEIYELLRVYLLDLIMVECGM